MKKNIIINCLMLLALIVSGCSGGNEKALLDSIAIAQSNLDNINEEYERLMIAQDARQARNDSIQKAQEQKEQAERAGFDAMISKCEAEANKFIEYTRKIEQTDNWDYCEQVSEAYDKYNNIHSKLMKVIDKMSNEQIERVRKMESRVKDTPILCWG